MSIFPSAGERVCMGCPLSTQVLPGALESLLLVAPLRGGGESAICADRVFDQGAVAWAGVWLYSKNEPGGAPVSVVQCKHWKGKRIGADKVRELRGVMAAKSVTRGQFATTSSFTADAIAFAEANGIKLHDSSALLGVIATRSPAQRQALLDVAFEGDYWRPTCVDCGIKLVERKHAAGGKPFWECPKCRT